MPALCGNSLVTVFLLHIYHKICKYESLAEYVQGNSQPLSGWEIYIPLATTAPSRSPWTFNAASQTSRANLFPSRISHQTHHFFAFVTVTACISSARMLSAVLLTIHPSRSHWLISVLCSTLYDYGHFIVRKPSAFWRSRQLSCRLEDRPKSAGFQALLCCALLCLSVQVLAWHLAT